MPAGRVAMRRVREVLRLGFAGISKHEIARRTGLAASTVRETIARFKATGLDWPLPATVTDGDLEAKLYKNAGTKQGHRRHAEPDWACLHRELRRKHVTLSILWDEYIEQHSGGYRTRRRSLAKLLGIVDQLPPESLRLLLMEWSGRAPARTLDDGGCARSRLAPSTDNGDKEPDQAHRPHHASAHHSVDHRVPPLSCNRAHHGPPPFALFF